LASRPSGEQLTSRNRATSKLRTNEQLTG